MQLSTMQLPATGACLRGQRLGSMRCVVTAPAARPSVIARYRFGEYQPDQAGSPDFPVDERAQIVATGVVFSPSEELNSLLPTFENEIGALGPSGVALKSMARMDFARKPEVALNEQINVELNMSYLYLSAAAYFARDNVGLPGFAAFFHSESEAEREHAMKLMRFQTRRGGRVKLASLLAPQTEFDHPEKGDALHVAEIALCLEKLNFARLRQLYSLAEEADDADMTQYLDNLLEEQSNDIQEAAVFVSQLQRAGRGLGVITIDYALQKKFGVAGADDGKLAVTPLLD